MKKYWNRLLAGGMALAMALTLLPVQTLAQELWASPEAEPQVDAATRSITLPVLTQDGEIPLSEEEEETGPITYVYETQDSFSLETGRQGNRLYVLDPVTHEKLKTDLNDSYTLILTDANGNGAAREDGVRCYRDGEWVDTGYVETYCYVGSAYFDNVTLTPGTYSIELVAGTTTYPCLGRVEVVSSGKLMLSGASIYDLYAGASEFEVQLGIYGLEKEDELNNFTLILTDANGDEVAKNSGYRLANSYSSGKWTFYARMTVQKGKAIAASEKYSLTITYSDGAAKELVNGVSAITRSAEAARAQLTGFQILDPQTAQIQVDLNGLEEGKTYLLEVRNGDSRGAIVGSQKWAAEKAGKGSVTLSLLLSDASARRPISAFESRFYVTLSVMVAGDGYEYEQWQDGESYDNPYANLHESSAAYLTPYYLKVKPTNDQVEFKMYLYNLNLWKGEGDVLTLVSAAEQEVARCDEIISSSDGNTLLLSGTLKITGTLTAGESYYVRLNGTDVDDVYVVGSIHTMDSMPFSEYRNGVETFWTNLGVFPVTVDVINAPADTTAELQIRDADGEKILLRSGELKATASDYYDHQCFRYSFPADEMEFIDGGNYQLVMLIGGETWFLSGGGNSKFLYSGTHTEFTPAATRYYNISWYDAKVGDQTVEGWVTLGDRNGLKNIAREELDLLKGLVISTEDASWHVEKIELSEKVDYSCEMTLTLDKPLTAGEYSVLYNRKSIDSFTITAAAESGTPRIYSYYDGKITGVWLPETGKYTASIYQGYTMVKPSFDLTRQGKCDGENQTLVLPKSAISDLAEGSYDIRVYLDGKLLGSDSFSVAAPTKPIVTLKNGDWVKTAVLSESYAYLEILNSGSYRYVRTAESKDALETVKFRHFTAGQSVNISIPTESVGARTLYVEFSQNGQSGGENIIYELPYWYWPGNDYGLQVSEDLQGVWTPPCTLEATLAIPAARVWATATDKDGNTATAELAYAGETEGRYRFALTVKDNDYFGKYNRIWTRDIQSVKFYATDYANTACYEVEGASDVYGNLRSEVVERVILFTSPASIVFLGGDTIYTNKTACTVRGFGPADTTLEVTLGSQDDSVATVKTDAHGLFTLTLNLSDWEENWYYLYFSSSDSSTTGGINLKVDRTAPKIENAAFAIVSETAALKWSCADTDVERFEIYKGDAAMPAHTIEPNETGNYSVNVSFKMGDADTTFHIKAYDRAGNVAETDVSTADNVKPVMSGTLTVGTITDSTVALSWTAATDNVGVKDYKVTWDGDKSVFVRDTTSCTVTGLTQGSKYTFKVYARDTAGNLSESCAAATASTLALTLTPTVDGTITVDEFYKNKLVPVSFTVTADTEEGDEFTPTIRSAKMYYQKADSADKIDEAAWTEVSLTTSGNTASGSWDISGDNGGYLLGSYQVYFKAEYATGLYLKSDPQTVTLERDKVAPEAPTNVQGTKHTTTTITLTWDAAKDNVGVTEYVIYRNGQEVGTSTTCEFVDKDLTSGKSYTYTVKAKDAAGNHSEASKAVELTTLKLEFASVMDFADSYVMEEQKDGVIAVSAVFQPIEGYEPEIMVHLQYQRLDKNNAGEGWRSVKLNAGENNTFTGSWPLTVNGEYLPEGEYQVRFSVTDGAATVYSSEQTVELKRDEEVPTVTRLKTGIDRDDSATHFGGTKILNVDVDATDNIGVTKMELSYAKADSDQYTVLKTQEGEATKTFWLHFEWNPNGLPSGEYTLKAVAYDARGNESAALTKDVTVDNTPPAAPGSVTVTGTSRYIHVMWEKDYVSPVDFQAFRVYRSESGAGEFTMVMERKAIGYFDDANGGIEAGKTYDYYVTAVDDLGNESAPTEPLSATYVADMESPTIGDMLPRDNAGLIKNPLLRVSASDNYRLARAEFYYMLDGDKDWTLIDSVNAKEDEDHKINNQVFNLTWTNMPKVEKETTCQIKALVYDASVNETQNDEYKANDPAEKIVNVTIKPYNAPMAPELTGTAGYLTATLKWTYGGDTDLLRDFIVYKVDEYGNRTYVTSVTDTRRSCTVALPPASEGETTFVVVATDLFGEKADSNTVTLTSVGADTEAPEAVIQPETLRAAAGVPFAFSGAGSTDNVGIVSYEWSFGNGKTGVGAQCEHTYAAAGTYTVTLTVKDAAGNADTATATMTVYDISKDSEYALLTVTAVNAYVEGTPPIEGAEIRIYSSDPTAKESDLGSAFTDAEGKASIVVPVGVRSLTAVADGYLPVSRSFTVRPDENGRDSYDLGMTPMGVSMVDGKLTAEEMTLEEIVEAGIDPSDPANQHVWKFRTELQFYATPSLKFNLPVTGYYNGNGDIVGRAGNGWGWNNFTISGGAGGGTSNQMRVGVFPISEYCILVVYGEAHWLKEMYHVELLVTNNSYTDNIINCNATLELPDGLSLVGGGGLTQGIPLIPAKTADDNGSNSASFDWYVRGDAAGEYRLTATVTGQNPEPFLKTFTMEEPIKVYAGNALRLTITAGDIAFQGEEYHVQFKLTNVSDKTLYNLSFGLTGANQFRMVTVGDKTQPINLTNENFEDGMTAPIPELKPGDSVTVDFFTETWFSSLLELAEMGPFDVGYLLTGVFLTTLEGSSTTIPYTVNIEKASHGSFYEWALDRAEDGAVDLVADWLDKGLPVSVPVVKAGVKIYRFASKTIDRKSMTSTIVITVDENGSFRTNEVRPQALTNSASVVEVYTDAAPADYTISADGKTMTITGDATIYVKGNEAGKSTVTFKTYAEVPDTVNGGSKQRTCGVALAYEVDGGQAAGDPARIVLNPPAETTVAVPLEGKTASVTFPYAVLDADNHYLAADGLTWSVTDGNGKDASGVSMMNGVLTVLPTAKAGTYTVTAALDGLAASQKIELTKEDPTATRICVLRNGLELTADTLMIPISGEVSYFYTAKLLDQYGCVLKDLTLAASPLPKEVAFDEKNGKLTLTKDSQPGTVTLTAKDEESSLTATVTITITNLVVDWSGVESAIEKTAYTYGDANGKAALPASGTAKAAGTTVNGTFAIADADAIQNAGDGTITVTFTVTDEGAYHDAVLTKTFPITIAKKALADSMITITGSYTYTGSTITPTYAVADGTLMKANDYAVTVSDNINAGTATVTVTASADGNYIGSASKTFTIAKAAITGFAAEAPSHTLLANDEANSSLSALKTAANLPGTVAVTFGENGTATLPITWADSRETFDPKGGTYHYVGTVAAGENFQPCEKTLTAAVTVTPVTGTVAWMTNAITLAKAQVDAAGSLSDLGLPASLTVTYDNGVGEATYTLTDANYTVTLAYLKSLSVAQGDRTVEIAVTGEPFPAWATIDTSALRAALTITEKFPVTVTVTPPAGIIYGETLGAPSATQTEVSHGTDENATYRYQYKLVDAPDTAWTETAPTQAGSYLVRATLVSDTHSGSGTAAFTIEKKALTADMITVTGDYTYTGSAIEPAYTVADGALMTAADYTVTVSNNLDAGDGTITVTAAEGGNYTGSASQTFTIRARSLTDSGVTVAPLAEETYRGSDLTPIPAVSFGGRRLVLGTDFTVDYQNNINAGAATAIIEGRGNFTGSREVTFTIQPAALSGTLTLQGGAAVGDVLTAVRSVESEGTYQWYRNGKAIQDATGDSYTITADDGNAALTVRFTASGNYTGTLESAAVKVGKQLLTGTVTLSADTAEVGDALTLSGTVNGEDITAESEHYQIQWLRDGAAISGANGLTYTAAKADRGHTLTAALIATGETYTGSLTSGGVSVSTEAPTLRLTATAGNGQVTLSWTVENGGGRITRFLLTGPDGITLTLAAEENSYTYTGLTNGTAYTFQLTVQTAEGKSAADTVSATPKAASGGISGGSGGQEDPGTTVTNPDGSVTTTVVDEATGSVTETTRYPDGGVTTVTTGTDGTVETEIRRADGVKVTAKETADGSLDFQAELPKSVSSARVKVPASLGKDPGQVTVTLTDASGKTWTETVRYRNGSLILTLDASVTGVLSTDFQPVQRFRDVPFGSYCTDAVDWAAELGITTGTTPETFSPAASCTRAQMTVFLWRAMGCPDADGTLLPDVDANAYYAKAILWAQAMGITKGTANGTFDPNGTVNRAQMVTFLWRLAGEPAGRGTLPFTDVDADAYYAEAVRWAVAQGITKGTTASTFAPNEPCNRGQIVTFLYRYLEH